MDRDSIELARRGEERGLEAIYRELAPAVLGYLRGQGLRDPEDAASEVFVGMVRGLDRFQGDEADLRTWLFSIAHRRVVDERRRLGRRPEVLVDPEDLRGPLSSAVTGDAETEALESVGSGWALAMLDTLTPDQRSVILLRVLADLSVERSAAVLGKTPGAVKTLQRRALAALGREIERQGVS
jgi:RNA polymerase sigma factor (sigma-70 family)